MTKAKAIALLNEMHSHCILRSATDAYDDALRDQKGEALMMAIEALSKPTVSGWIPVTERMPEPRIDVWCNSDMGQMVGYYDEYAETWYGRDYLELIVTAWMPLPEPYQEEGEK